MSRVSSSSNLGTLRRSRHRGRAARIAAATLALGVATLVAFVGQRDPRQPPRPEVPAVTPPVAAAMLVPHAWLDPQPSPLLEAMRFTRGQLFTRGEVPEASFVLASREAASARAVEPAAAAPPPGTTVPPTPLAAPARLAFAPLPVPRPSGLAPPQVAPPKVADAAARPERRDPRRPPGPAPAPAEESGFLEKFFGLEPTPKPVLAYAALEGPGLQRGPLGRLDPAPTARGGTAVYDITARTVTLPSGERLEAHSGLGDKMDDPRFVHVRMRGATPPGTYDLTERESLFHGVRAIRMSPVGGSGAIHGRDGILAHTYMLGPRGDSNGCVSFRNYDRFLQAFLRGEVSRLVVVAGNGLPRLADGVSPRGRGADRDG